MRGRESRGRLVKPPKGEARGTHEEGAMYKGPRFTAVLAPMPRTHPYVTAETQSPGVYVRLPLVHTAAIKKKLYFFFSFLLMCTLLQERSINEV